MSSTRHLVDPELLPLIEAAPPLVLARESLAATRIMLDQRFESLPEPELPVSRALARSRGGSEEVPVLVIAPPGPGPRPALLHVHGGGMVTGTAFAFRRWAAEVAAATGAVVVSVDYRLAPETAFPGQIEDCYTALCWLFDEHERLGIDPARVALIGESAGAGLAAALALAVRDHGSHTLRGQALTYPMLDYRTGSTADPYCNPITGAFVWTRAANQFGWSCLRGDYEPGDGREGWFSPMLARRLDGLPPALILTGALDLFYDENLEYARRLCAAGAPVELHAYAGAVHGFIRFEQARVSQTYRRDLFAGLGRMLAPAAAGRDP